MHLLQVKYQIFLTFGLMAEPAAEVVGTGQSYSSKIAGNFMLISLVYLFIGIFWMGPGSFLLPSPSGDAGAAFDTARWHIVFIGFVGFNIMGLMYHVAPQVGGRPLHSARLARIHFWSSNVLFPVAVVIEVIGVSAYQDALNNSFDPSTFPAGLLALFILIIVLFFAGIASQIPFAYNIYKTIKG